jgi:hypothetical protein
VNLIIKDAISTPILCMISPITCIKASNHSHRRRTDLTYSPLIDDRSELEIHVESPVDNKPKHKHHKNINVRAAFIHVIGDINKSCDCKPCDMMVCIVVM